MKVMGYHQKNRACTKRQGFKLPIRVTSQKWGAYKKKKRNNEYIQTVDKNRFSLEFLTSEENGHENCFPYRHTFQIHLEIR